MAASKQDLEAHAYVALPDVAAQFSLGNTATSQRPAQHGAAAAAQDFPAAHSAASKAHAGDQRGDVSDLSQGRGTGKGHRRTGVCSALVLSG
eukprot:4954841-Pleurochrysis_carterae.AAC.1